MVNGKVKMFDKVRGWGFATADDGNDIFIHHTDILLKDGLEIGDVITFDIEETERGKKAKNVEVIKEGIYT